MEVGARFSSRGVSVLTLGSVSRGLTAVAASEPSLSLSSMRSSNRCLCHEPESFLQKTTQAGCFTPGKGEGLSGFLFASRYLRGTVGPDLAHLELHARCTRY